MQTFLPYRSFQESAKCLDRARLGKQRIEAFDILVINEGIKPDFMSDIQFEYINKRYKNHPAVLMWKGYPYTLYDYTKVICLEWQRRGYKGVTLERLEQYLTSIVTKIKAEPTYPDWLKYSDSNGLCLSHKSNLLRKSSSHYRPIFGQNIPDNLPYYWPVTKDTI